MCYYSDKTKLRFKNKASYTHAARRRTRPRASPARRRGRDLTLRDVAPAKHSASHDHEK